MTTAAKRPELVELFTHNPSGPGFEDSFVLYADGIIEIHAEVDPRLPTSKVGSFQLEEAATKKLFLALKNFYEPSTAETAAKASILETLENTAQLVQEL